MRCLCIFADVLRRLKPLPMTLSILATLKFQGGLLDPVAYRSLTEVLPQRQLPGALDVD